MKKVYKDGNSCVCSPQQADILIAAGWSYKEQSTKSAPKKVAAKKAATKE